MGILKEIATNLSFSASHRDKQRELIDTLAHYKMLLKNKEDTRAFLTSNMWYMQNLVNNRLRKHNIALTEYSIATSDSKKNRGQWYEAVTSTDGKNISTEISDSDNRYKVYSGKINKLKIKDRYNRSYIFISSIIQTDQRIVCPNCGAPSYKEELYESCPYCSSKFNFDEFNDKLAHVIPSVIGNRELGKVIILALCIDAIVTIYFLVSTNNIWTILIALPFFLISWLIASVISAPVLIYSKVKFHRTRQLQWNMQKTDEYFSYNNFLGTALHRLKVWALAEDTYMLQLTSNKSANEQSYIDVNIIEYRGAKIYNSCYISLEAKVLFVKCKNGQLITEKKNIQMMFCRNMNVKTQLKIDFEMIRCTSCSATIKISDGGICRYCGSYLDIKNYDWVLVDIKISNPSVF